MRSRLMVILFLSQTLTVAAQQKDTFEVYFPFNKPNLTKESAEYIDKLVFNDTLIHGDKLTIFGYADYVGGNKHNDTLSRQRAKAVKDYLATMGFDKNDITLCIGKGKIDRTGISGRDGYAPDRKVQIVINHVAAAPPPAPVPALAPAKKEVKTIDKADISKMAVNESFAMNNINFEPGSPELLPQSYPTLRILLGFMQQYPTLKIRIEGHICCIGPLEGDMTFPNTNVTLSELRAITIMQYLIKKGISKDRMQAIGLGNRNPVVPEDLTEEDHIKNRRVEVRILSK